MLDDTCRAKLDKAGIARVNGPCGGWALEGDQIALDTAGRGFGILPREIAEGLLPLLQLGHDLTHLPGYLFLVGRVGAQVDLVNRVFLDALRLLQAIDDGLSLRIAHILGWRDAAAQIALPGEPGLDLPSTPRGEVWEWSFPNPEAWDADAVRPLREAVSDKIQTTLLAR